MKKVLVGFIMDGRSGGIDKYLLNFLDNVQGENIRIDFLTNEIHPDLKEYLKERHSRIFAISGLRHPVRQYRQVSGIIEKGQYDIVYLNISTAIDCIAALAAKRMKVKRVLLHSHSSGNDCENLIKRKAFDIIHYTCRLFLYKTAAEYYGCSNKAGLWMFPRKVVESPAFSTVFNAVDTEKFSFSPDVRSKERLALDVEDKLVIGHVGNFVYQKNHFFLLDVFEQVKKSRADAVLLLIGTGERLEAARQLAKQKGIEDSVKFLGFRKDVDRLFQAMDFFVLPSNFEGLPTVGVEAQCAGLPCLMSDSITEEVKITDRCFFLPLSEKAEVWSRFILSHISCKREEIGWIGSRAEYSLESLKMKQRCIINKRSQRCY